jgi:zinc transport system substrate-binding protein
MFHFPKLLAGLTATVGLGIFLAFSGCGKAPDPWQDIPGGPTRVVACFPPLFCFAKSVAGRDAAVMSLLMTTGPHEYEPGGLDPLTLQKADLFLANGLGLDNKVINMARSSGNPHLRIIQLAHAIPQNMLLEMGENEEHEKEHGKEGHEHHHGDHDPHVWLGIPEAVLMVERIRDALKKQDPEHAAGFDKRSAAYVAELRDLQAYGKKALAGKKNRKFIATHESLAYFSRAFGLELVDTIQPQPGIEADAVKLAQLVEVCKKDKIRVLAVEPQYSRTTAETLRRQLAALKLPVEIVEVDPLETADPPLEPDLYVRKMRENIDVLARNLR